jgi:ribosomal-protein-alanine N-acetyltransferase
MIKHTDMNSALNPPLHSARLDLEPFEANHAMALHKGLSSPALYDFIPDDPPDLEALIHRYRRLESRSAPDGMQAWLNWAIKRREDGAYCGYVQATVDHPTRSAFIAYLVFVDFGHQGIAHEAVAAMLAHLHTQDCVDRFEAQIDRRNIRSIALVEALGFQRFREIEDADFFKGSTSHEVHFELEAGATMLATRYRDASGSLQR